MFVGRHWLFREIHEHLTSDLPTNRGVVISGGPGSGKTAIILQLVENSCFGRRDVESNPVQEEIYPGTKIETTL